MISVYILVLGLAAIAVGLFEALQPLRALGLWKQWIAHRYFFLHGGLLIALGLPLTCGDGTLIGKIIFTMGLIMVFTGPFILLYAGRIRRMFMSVTAEMDGPALKRLICIDAAVRISAGAIFTIQYFL
jgi:hypothetical protein